MKLYPTLVKIVQSIFLQKLIKSSHLNRKNHKDEWVENWCEGVLPIAFFQSKEE